jgi:hypothetical protein
MLWMFVLSALSCYGGLVVLVFFFQRHLVYIPQRRLVATPSDGGLEYETVWLDTDDGERVHGWFVLAEQPRGVVLFFHGNGGNISHCIDTLQSYHRLGLSTLMIDYRGYGQSSGTPDEPGTYRDAAAAWRYLIETRHVPPDRIVVIGRSLGGGVASWVAQTYQPGALVLESTFTSLPDIGAELYPFLPVRVLSQTHYPTIERLDEIAAPVLVIHSHDDTLVPYRHGQQLYAAAHHPKGFLNLNGSHDGGFVDSIRVYEAGLDRFLTAQGFVPVVGGE